MERNSEIDEKIIVSVITDISVQKPLDYSVPLVLQPKIKKGMRVEVPIKGKIKKGFVFEIKNHSFFPNIKPIHQIISDDELIPEDLFELALWMTKFYCTPLNQVLKTILPATVRNGIKPKQQLFIMRKKTKDELANLAVELRNKHPAQADVLDVMMQVKKGILLSELLEKTKGSRSPIDSLIKKGILEYDIVRIERSPLINEEYITTKPKILNSSQKDALDKITDALNNQRFETHLLYGITGSGKTEIYLQAISKALESGKGVIMLVPEISLTPQTIERFRSRFEGNIAVLHHRLSQGERIDEWDRIKKGEAKIVIGARSAVFSPVQNLGLIIVDEEHESSYKQNEEMPAYHSREIAIMRGKMNRSVVILGSATPSLESYHNTKTGKFHLSKLQTRADGASLPKVTIVDMKKQYEKASGYTNFSEQLLDAIKKRQDSGEQTILFLNRRGYHTSMLCQKCHGNIKCKHCEVALTLHMKEKTLSCHLCGYTIEPPNQCATCGHTGLMKYKGVGTELIETSLKAIFPEVRTLRIDADTTRHKGSHQKLLKEFGSGKADVLIGTQMIAKGLHFPQVTLVGVLNCDGPLHIPDFRASEMVFQLVTQVSGRAGRSQELPGEVILQTCIPENHILNLAAEQNYEAFFEKELVERQLFNFPPLFSLVKLLFSGIDPKITFETAQKFRDKLLHILPPNCELHPVLPSGYPKIKDRYRFQFLIRGPNILTISNGIETLRNSHKIPSNVRLFIDINPLSTYF